MPRTTSPRRPAWRTGAVAIALCAATALTGCSTGSSADSAHGHGSRTAEPRAMTSSVRHPATPAATTSPAANRARAGELTPDQAAGRRIIYSYPGTTPPASLIDRIKAGEVAGVIFFGENIASTSQITSVIKQLKDANAQSPVHEPLLLLTDQEGGPIRRLPGAPETSAKQDGAAADPVAASREAGQQAAQNLAGVGMNTNAAPVLGVYRQPDDFLDHNERSFSTDPNQVGQDAAAFISGQQGSGVAATAKHFPGLGAAAQQENTDERAVTLNVPLNTLRTVDEAPYPKAFAAGVKLVMPSWAVYPALDPNRPAGLSAKVVRDELRGRLGFQGVTITDALEAKSLQAFGTTGQRAVAAAQADDDLILASARSVSQGEQASQALSHALSSGQLNKADFDASVARIDALRRGLSG